MSPMTSCPLHVAIMMDGNGRWALRRGEPRSSGHQRGAENVRAIVQAAVELGVATLTLHAFSSDNWRRPTREVAALMRLLHDYLEKEAAHCARHDIRISVIGRRDRLPAVLRQTIEAAETATAAGSRFHLRLAVDYSAREAIFRAACRFYKATRVSRESFEEVLGEVSHGGVPELDFLIRTGGEQRLSDFLLWECAYAELYFTRKMWPEFTAQDFAAALAEFRSRDRRFGSVPEAVAS
ncbi:MAG TPA: polyprenyl diphosphate synthase [Candidatus Acidoferrales bacterium]|jgi:undecaprenyl diphosphate synthase|nr:polyprenyl diphosphate synthase [Candidatus Acidoferrales bacterium]